MRNNFSTNRVKHALTVSHRGLTRQLMHDPSLPEELVDALWNDPDNRLLPQATALQEKDRCTVYRVDYPLKDKPQQSFLIKRHVWGPVSRAARMLWRQPTATRCAAVAALLTEHGISTPAIRGCMVDGIGPFSYRSYLLTDFIQGESLFHAVRSGKIPRERLPHVARQVATIWQGLITLNISHNDLKPENFMVDEALRVWLIDFEKTKINRNQTKLQSRHLEDVERFLHIRSWRTDAETAEIFRQELLQTTLRQWATESKAAGHHLLRKGYTSAELDNKISVVVPVSSQQFDSPALEKTINSVRDVADEILLVDPQERETKNPQHPWVFVLLPGELATPDLVRHLPEWVLEAEAASLETDAFELPISQSLINSSATPTSCRVFHRGRCELSFADGNPTVTVKEGRAATTRFGLLASGQCASIPHSAVPLSDAA